MGNPGMQNSRFSKISLIIILGIILFLGAFLVYQQLNVGKDVRGSAKIKIEFGSPGMIVLPEEVTFFTEATPIPWEKCSICVYNPKDYHIVNASAQIEFPDTLEYRINIDELTEFYYEPAISTFSIRDFGNYEENTQCDWFEIRPKTFVLSNGTKIHVKYSISYSYDPNAGKGSSLASDTNFISMSKNRTQDISIFTSLRNKTLSQTIQEYTWIFAFLGCVFSCILILYGPGGKHRIEWLRGKIIKKR